MINEITARKKRHRNTLNAKLGKSVVAERFMRILKNKIYKYITSISKNVTEMKYILNVTFVISLEYENIKTFLQNFILGIGLKKLVIKKVKNPVPWTYAISYLNREENVRTFFEKELQKTNQKGFRVEKVIKRKSDKLHDEWKGYYSSFNSWIDKKDMYK